MPRAMLASLRTQRTAPDIRLFPLFGGNSWHPDKVSLTVLHAVPRKACPNARRPWPQCKEGVACPQGFRSLDYPSLPLEMSNHRLPQCDEAKPQCNVGVSRNLPDHAPDANGLPEKQCTRLGHECDYSHKVAFKDETLKVVDKYLGADRPRNLPWNPATRLHISSDLQRIAADDVLPPFTTLTNDDDRQRKAEYRPPGTYVVVATPSSFADLEEYKSPGEEQARRSTTIHTDLTSNLTTNVAVDSETLILGTFEEHPQTPIHWSRTDSSTLGLREFELRSPQSPAPARISRNPDSLRVSPPPLPETSHPVATTTRDREHELRLHYKHFVRRHLVQIRRETSNVSAEWAAHDTDLFEQEASKYPPVTAAEPYWTTHLAQLERLVHLRRNVYSIDPFPSIVWWICIVDIHALLSGIGKGTFVSSLMRRGQVPTPLEMLDGPGLAEPGVRAPEEASLMPSILEVHQTVSLLAARLGFLASSLRELARMQGPSEQAAVAQASHVRWQQQVQDLRDSLKKAWTMPDSLALATSYRDGILPGRVQGLFEHVGQRSTPPIVTRNVQELEWRGMWPTQRIDTNAEPLDEISQCASEILNVVSGTVRRCQYEHGYVIFSLLLAGVATPSAAHKMLALELMLAMEQESIGSNKRRTRKLLEAVYERQSARQMAVGHSLDVDWIQVMMDTGMQVINFGL
ncbi:hypothetical protein MMC13_000489 [Lambiella insularis]|nr:hypothetical protein [Lambiella insularis]